MAVTPIGAPVTPAVQKPVARVEREEATRISTPGLM